VRRSRSTLGRAPGHVPPASRITSRQVVHETLPGTRCPGLAQDQAGEAVDRQWPRSLPRGGVLLGPCSLTGLGHQDVVRRRLSRLPGQHPQHHREEQKEFVGSWPDEGPPIESRAAGQGRLREFGIDTVAENSQPAPSEDEAARRARLTRPGCPCRMKTSARVDARAERKERRYASRAKMARRTAR